MSELKGLAHIGLHTRDIEMSKSFYIEYLGFTLEYETRLDKPNNEWLDLSFISLNGLVIELIEPSDREKAKMGNVGSINHIAIEVKNLPELMKQLKSRGVLFESDQPRRVEKLFKGVQVAFLQGPNGERIELFEYLG